MLYYMTFKRAACQPMETPYMSLKKLMLLVALQLALLCPAAYAQDEEAAKVTDVQIAGNRKVEAETIRSKVSVKAGDAFSPSRIRSDISSIFRMGYFSDVKVEADGYAGGVRLIFRVVERPIISSYTFEGNKAIESAKLREKVNLTAYSVYNPQLVAENAERLRLHYQSEGYYNARVLPIIKESEKDVKVTYLVDEGGKVKVSKIKFTGNEKKSSRKLRKAMSTKKYIFLWSWLLKTGHYKVLELNQDVERIKSVYYNAGYIQVSVGELEVALSGDGGKLVITIPVKEGEQFSIGKIDVSGNAVFGREELLASVESKEGKVMDRDLVKKDVTALTDLYGTKGYAFATISPVLKPDVDKRLVDVMLEVNEGEQIFVNRINIAGNVKTRDKVIRRELKFDE